MKTVRTVTYLSDRKYDLHLQSMYENKLNILSGTEWDARDGKETIYVTTCMAREEAEKIRDLLVAKELPAGIVESRQQKGSFRVLVKEQSITAYVDAQTKRSSMRFS